MTTEFSTDFDPWQHLMTLTQVVNDLVDQHNRLSAHHLELCRQHQRLILEVEKLRQRTPTL